MRENPMFARIWSVFIVTVTLLTITSGGHSGIAAQAQVSTQAPTLQSSPILTITSANSHSIMVRNIWHISGVPVSLSFSPDGAILAAGLGGRTIQLWNTEMCQIFLTIIE